MARQSLSKTNDWQLIHDDQDIRGHRMMNAAGDTIGIVDDLIVDTDTQMVDTIVLDDGTEYPAREIEIDDQQAYLQGAAAPETGSVRIYDDVPVEQTPKRHV